MNKFTSIVAILFISLSSLSSCKLIRIAKRPIRKNDSTNVVKALDTFRKIDTAKIATPTTPVVDTKNVLMMTLQPLLQKKIDYRTFSAKVKMRYDAPSNKIDFVTNIRMKRDSAIWINVSVSMVVQLQVARVLVTRDSFKYINYQTGQVTILPISKASTLVPAPIDFDILQNFILGNVLVTNAKVTDASSVNGVWSLNAEDPNYLQLIKYTQSDSSLLTSQLRTRTASGPQGIIQYSDYLLNENRRFSTRRFVSIQNVGEQYTLDMNFANEEFDQPVEMPFNIPEGYEIINK